MKNRTTIFKISVAILIIALVFAILLTIQALILSSIYSEKKNDEQAMYNSMSFSDRLTYNRVRYDWNFGYEYSRFFDKDVEKNKTFYIGDKENKINYCFSYNDLFQYNHNPENVPESFVMHIYIDKNKNIYMYDSKNNFRRYFKYGKHSGEGSKRQEASLSQEEARQKGLAFCKNLLPSLEGLDTKNYYSDYTGYEFIYTKKLSKLFSVNARFIISNEGEIIMVGNSMINTIDSITDDEEKDVLQRLDNFIKKHYADTILKYEICDDGNEIQCLIIDGQCIVRFNVKFFPCDNKDPYTESIALRIK